MSIRATSRPDAPERPYTERECYRCGIRWTDNHRLWVKDAPCYGCRLQLRSEGVDVQQFKLPGREKYRPTRDAA